MLEYDRIDVWEEIYVKKTGGLRECIICRYWYFLVINFRLSLEVCNGCHDLMQKAVSFNNIAILTFKINKYRIDLLYMTKDEAINVLRNANLSNYKK